MKNQPFQLPNFDHNRGASPTRNLLEQTRLSRLPTLPNRSPCENCGGKLNADDEFQSSVKLCRECLRNYANIGIILDRHAERKIRRNFRGDK